MKLVLLDIKADKAIPGSEKAAEGFRNLLQGMLSAGTLTGADAIAVIPAGVSVEVREILREGPPPPPPLVLPEVAPSPLPPPSWMQPASPYGTITC